jgi:hypothetical protein
MSSDRVQQLCARLGEDAVAAEDAWPETSWRGGVGRSVTLRRVRFRDLELQPGERVDLSSTLTVPEHIHGVSSPASRWGCTLTRCTRGWPQPGRDRDDQSSGLGAGGRGHAPRPLRPRCRLDGRIRRRGTSDPDHRAGPCPGSGSRGGAAVIIASVQGRRIWAARGSTTYACAKSAQAGVCAQGGGRTGGGPHPRQHDLSGCGGHADRGIDHAAEPGSHSPRDPGSSPGHLPKGGRRHRPEEVAELACFLLSPRASAISGTEVLIDGAASLS